MNILLKIGFLPIYFLLPCFTLFAEPSVFIQQLSKLERARELKRSFKNISLSSAVSQGLSKNYDEQIRGNQEKIEALNWDNLKDSFWLPNVSIDFTTSKHRLGSLTSGNSFTYDKDPSGTLALNFGEYTIFNWGKDYLQFKNDLATISRSQESLSEQRRNLKHQLVIEYFNLVTLKRLEKSSRDILRQSSFIYRFARERLGLRRIAKHDVMAARDTYLQAQADFYTLKERIKTASENIAFIIQDPVGTEYVVTEEINFRKLTMPISEAVVLAHKYSQYTKQSEYELVNSKRSYEISIKENLPLPKITLGLGAYQHAFGSGISSTQYVNGTGDRLEVVASVNATWSILGHGGLFNKRTRIGKLLEFNQAQINHQRYKHFLDSKVRTYYQQIKNSEKLYLIYKVKLENLNRTFDYIMDRYMSNKISFLYFKTYLEELSLTTDNFYSTLYSHLKYKVELAKLMGIDEFPGEPLSQLVTKVVN